MSEISILNNSIVPDREFEAVWFIDRTGDRSILDSFMENHDFTHSRARARDNLVASIVPSDISWDENRIILEEHGLMLPPAPAINNDRYMNISSRRNSSIPITNFINYIGNLTGRQVTTPSTFVPVIVDENMEVTEEQCSCCICIIDNKAKSEICRISCGHTFCIDCCRGTMSSKFRRGENMTCPLCRTTITSVSIKNIENKNKFLVNH
jgi:hypothetical protein